MINVAKKWQINAAVCSCLTWPFAAGFTLGGEHLATKIIGSIVWLNSILCFLWLNRGDPNTWNPHWIEHNMKYDSYMIAANKEVEELLK